MEEIEDFLDEKTFEVSVTTRGRIRGCQDYLPQSATMTRSLALHILGNSHGNVKCLYHHLRRAEPRVDGQGYNDKGMMLTGITGKPVKNGKDVAVGTHLHCGCETNEALMYFLMWKTWVLRSAAGVTEGLMSQHMLPRMRSLVINEYFKGTAITVDDLYSSRLRDYNSLEEEKRRSLCIIRRHLLQVGGINLNLGLVSLSRADLELAGLSFRSEADVPSGCHLVFRWDSTITDGKEAAKGEGKLPEKNEVEGMGESSG